MLTFWWFLEWWFEAVHVVATVTVITEQQLVIILRGATEMAGLALNTLPAIGANNLSQRLRKLHTRWMS